MWASSPEDRPPFEVIRQRLSAFLEVQSDAYGYIQVSQDYGRFYSRIEIPPKPTAPVEEVPEMIVSKENNDENDPVSV